MCNYRVDIEAILSVKLGKTRGFRTMVLISCYLSGLQRQYYYYYVSVSISLAGVNNDSKDHDVIWSIENSGIDLLRWIVLEACI